MDGSQLFLVQGNGPPKLIEQGQHFPFIVVSPQVLFTNDQYWVTSDLSTLLDYMKDNYAIDEDRIYVTGQSMGGFGSWYWAEDEPNTFAALAPIAGGGRPSRAAAISHIPIWNFHGDADPTVSIAYSDNTISALVAAGSSARSTVYPGVGHNSWTRTYNNLDLYDWIAAQSKSPIAMPEDLVVSINCLGSSGGASDLLAPSTSWGVLDEGLFLPNWNNVASNLSHPVFSTGAPSSLTVSTLRSDGSAVFGMHANTALNAGLLKHVSSAGEVQVRIDGLKANFPNGCYAVVYLTGETANTGASINDGIETRWFSTNVRSPYTLSPTTQASDLGPGNNPVATVAQFGSPSSPIATDHLTLTLDNASGGAAAIAGIQLVGLADPLPTPVLTVNSVVQEEGDAGTTQMVFDVRLSPASGTPVAVDVSTQEGSAVAGGDFTGLAPFSLIFNPGETNKTVTVNLLGDTLAEEHEAFRLVLTNAIGAVTAYGVTGQGTILNDDFDLPVITSPTAVTLSEALPIDYQITALNTPTSFGILAGPPGMTVDSATGVIHWTPFAPGNYSVDVLASNPAGSDVVSVAIEVLANPLVSAADVQGIPLRVSGADWVVQTTNTFDGVDALGSSESPADNETYTVSALVMGPGTIQFYWRVSSEPDFDWLQFSRGGEELAAISGEQNWAMFTTNLVEGIQELSWRYTKDGGVGMNQDRAYLDQITLGGYAAWVVRSELALSDAFFDQDPDGDTAFNLMEYAMDTLPTSGADTPAIAPYVEEGKVRLAVVKTADPGLAYEFQRADVLSGPWTPTLLQVLEDSPSTQRVEVMDAAGTQGYLRLQVLWQP